MKRSVMLIVDGLGLSGKTKALVDLACGLDASRFQPFVVCFNAEKSPLVDVLRQRGIPLLEVPIRESLSLVNLWRLVRVIRRERPDIVHCYNPRAMLYGGLAARLCGIRAVLGSLSAFACLVPDQEYNFLPQPLATVSYRNRLRNRFVAGLVRYIAVVSSKLGERFCAYNGIDPRQLRLVPYGVQAGVPPDSPERMENRRGTRQRLRLADNDIVVGSVGRLIEQKDYPTQLHGFAQALAEEPRLRMMLVGDGPLRGQLDDLAVQLGIRHRVDFLGYRADTEDLYHAMDVFALCSKFEPLGIAVLEAKANGVPILCAAVNELPEILSHGRCGRLFEASSSQAFASGLMELTRDTAASSRMAMSAFREAKERHGLAAMIQSYERLYEEILSSGG